MQNKVLVVDRDSRSLRLLEVSLKEAGYRVVTAASGQEALSQLEVELPDLVLADTDIGEVDAFVLYQHLQQRPEWAHLPFIFILDGDSAAEKLRAVQLGASDFLTRPVFLKEALSRVELLLEKQALRGEASAGPVSGRARFAGSLSGTALLDLLQTMEIGRKSGVASCVSGRGQRAVLYFAGGAVVDAELGPLRGLPALYRVLTFQGGEYRVELCPVQRPTHIELGTANLLQEATRRLEEWNRLCAALPPLTLLLSPAAGALQPEALPRPLREMLQHFAGQRSVLDVLDELDLEEADALEGAAPPDALSRLAAVAKLYAARLLTPAGRPISGEPRAPVPTPLAVPRLTPPASRPTPPPLPRMTPISVPRLTPLPPPVPLLTRPTPPPLPASEASSPGHNLARLAHLLAATRKPTSLTPAPLPLVTPLGSAAVAASIDPAGISWIGEAPEPEPLSIPELEQLADHSAPSWLPSAASAPAPGPKFEHTLPLSAAPMQLPPAPAPAPIPAEEAVHLSAPMLLGSIDMLPIEVEEGHPPPSRPALPPPAPPRSRVRQTVTWVIASAALFGLGVGLYWVRQELDREPTPTAMPSSPAVPRPQVAPTPAPTPPPPSASIEPAPAPSATVPVPVQEPPAPTAPTPPPATAPVASTPPPAAEPAPPPAADNEFTALMAKARAAEHRGSFSAAYHALHAAQRLQPRSAAALALQAQLALDEGNADKAAALAKRALLSDKQSADAYLVLGTVEQARAHASAAQAYFKKYLTLAPNGDRARDVRAVLRMSH